MQLVPHGFGDLNHLRSLLLRVCIVPHLVRMRDKLRDILLVQRVHDVPEVVSVRYATDRQFVGEVHHELCVILHQGPELLYGKLVVDRHVYKLDGLQLKHFFVSVEYCLKKVFVVHGLLWNVVLA